MRGFHLASSCSWGTLGTLPTSFYSLHWPVLSTLTAVEGRLLLTGKDVSVFCPCFLSSSCEEIDTEFKYHWLACGSSGGFRGRAHSSFVSATLRRSGISHLEYEWIEPSTRVLVTGYGVLAQEHQHMGVNMVASIPCVLIVLLEVVKDKSPSAGC